MNGLVWKVEPNDDCTSRTTDELFFFMQRCKGDIQIQRETIALNGRYGGQYNTKKHTEWCMSNLHRWEYCQRNNDHVWVAQRVFHFECGRVQLCCCSTNNNAPNCRLWIDPGCQLRSTSSHIFGVPSQWTLQNGANKNPRQRTRADEITCQFFFLVSFFQSNLERKKNADKIKRTSRCGVQRDQLCRLQPTNQSHTAMCNGFRSIKVVRIGLSLIRKANFQPVTWVKSTTRARFHCRTWDNFDTDVWSGRAAIRCASIFWHLFAVYSIRGRWQIS